MGCPALPRIAQTHRLQSQRDLGRNVHTENISTNSHGSFDVSSEGPAGPSLPWEGAPVRGFPPGFTVADLARKRRRPGPLPSDNIRARTGHIVNLCSEYARSFQPPEEPKSSVRQTAPLAAKARDDATRLPDQKESAPIAQPRPPEAHPSQVEAKPRPPAVQPSQVEAKPSQPEAQPSPLETLPNSHEAAKFPEAEEVTLDPGEAVEEAVEEADVRRTRRAEGVELPVAQPPSSAHVARAQMPRRRDLVAPSDPIGVCSPAALRRPVSLTRDGAAQLALLRAARRPELTRRSTSLKLEGEMSTETTNQALFPAHAFQGRRHSKRVSTVLKSEGEMLKTTENRAAYVEFAHAPRPALLRRHSCLRLEGSYTHAPLYNEVFRGVAPEERSVSQRRPDQLRLEGAVADVTETRASFETSGEGVRASAVRREDCIRTEGVFDPQPPMTQARPKPSDPGPPTRAKPADLGPPFDPGCRYEPISVLDLGPRYEPTKRFPGEKRHAARGNESLLIAGDTADERKEERRRREHIFDGVAMKAVMGEAQDVESNEVKRAAKDSVFTGREMKAVMESVQEKEARGRREASTSVFVGSEIKQAMDAKDVDGRVLRDVKDNIFEGREMKQVMHDMAVVSTDKAHVPVPAPAPVKADAAYREIFVDVKREASTDRSGLEPDAARRKSQPRMSRGELGPRAKPPPAVDAAVAPKRLPRRPPLDIFPTSPADALRSRRPSAELARSRPSSPEFARAAGGRKEFVDYSCKESLGGVRTRKLPRAHHDAGAERFTAFHVLGAPDGGNKGVATPRQRSPSPSYRLLVVPVEGRARPRASAQTPRSPQRTVSGSTSTNTGTDSANRSLTPTKSPRSPRRSPRPRKASPSTAPAHAFLVLDANNNDAGRRDVDLRKTYLELPGGGDALGAKKDAVETHWMAPWYEHPTST